MRVFVLVTAPDVAPDTTPDIALDVAPDIAPDTTPDVVPDTTPDVALDTLDAAPEVALDTQDIAPDTTLDVTPETDTTPDCPPRDVAGTLTTDETWCGEVSLAGFATVPVGLTLTILPGTTITGAGQLDVLGKLNAVGTAAAPIAFSKVGVWIRANGSLLEHVSIRDTYIPLEVSHAVTLHDVQLSGGYNGLKLTDAARVTADGLTISDTESKGILIGDVSAVTLTDLVVERAGEDGVYFTSHLPSSITGCRVVDNVANGLYVERGEPTLSDCTISDNGKNGVLFEDGGGSLTRSTVTGNGYEGVRIWVNSFASVTRSNLFGNAKLGAYVVERPMLVAATSLEGTGEVVSATYATPHGESIIHALVSVSELGAQEWTTEAALESASGTELIAFPEGREDEWYNVRSQNSTLRVRVSDESPINRVSITLRAVVYFQPGAVRELTIVSDSVITANTLYLGRFPDVGSVVSSGSRRGLFFGGLSGVPLDATYALKPPYFGAQTFDNGLAWSGEVWVSGDVGVGGTFDIAPGTVVHVVRSGVYDALGADISAGSGVVVTLRGSAQAPISIAGFGPGDGPGFGSFSLYDVDVTMRHVELADGEYVQIRDSRATIENVTIRRMSGPCLVIEDTTWTGGGVYDCGGVAGIELRERAVIDGVEVSGAKNAGVYADGYNSVMRNCDVHDNGSGVAVAGYSNPNVSHNRIAHNGVGVELYGDAEGLVSDNDIRDNDGEGVLVYPRALSGFATIVTRNNIVANGLRTPPVIAEPGLTLASSGGTGAFISDTWSTPGGAQIVLVLTTLFDTVHGSELTASLEVPPTADNAAGITLRTLSSYPALVAWDARFGAIDRVRFRFVAKAADVAGKALLRNVLYRAPAVGELTPVGVVGFITEGVVDFSGNYWGVPVADVEDVIQLVLPGTVDFDGAASQPFASAGPL